MTPRERAQLEINQWIWLRWFFTATACLFLWGGVLIFNEAHGFRVALSGTGPGFRIIHFVAIGAILWAVYKSWSLKIRRDRHQI